ncbi:MAG: phage virion morphogenesis protein [Candidatus Gastranaerophilaceae bacterium]
MSNDKCFKVKINANEIVSKLNALKQEFTDLTPFLKLISVKLLGAIDDNFATEGKSSGEKWKDWSDTYKKWKIKTWKSNSKTANPLILTSKANLWDSIRGEIEGNKLTIGSAMEYAAIHNFGLKKTVQKKNKKGTSFSCDMNMPQREFMRFSSETFEEILEDINEEALDRIQKHCNS